jgi:hypothetical protein
LRPLIIITFGQHRIATVETCKGGGADTTTSPNDLLILKTFGLRNMSADVCGHHFGAIWQAAVRRWATNARSAARAPTNPEPSR